MKLKLIALTTLMAFTTLTSTAFAAEKKAGEATEKKKRAVPYTGKISAVDKAAGSVTLATKSTNRTFMVTSETKITKDGKPATMEIVKEGEEGAVSYVEKDGKYMANSLRVSPKPPEEPKKKKKTE
jgi:Cu/Ag efflux protein CusF